MHTAELLGITTDQFPAVLIQAGGKTLRSDIHRLINYYLK